MTFYLKIRFFIFLFLFFLLLHCIKQTLLLDPDLPKCFYVASYHRGYAGQVVLEILAGISPSQIPIVANRKWNLAVNQSLLARTTLQIPFSLIRKAEKVRASDLNRN